MGRRGLFPLRGSLLSHEQSSASWSSSDQSIRSILCSLLRNTAKNFPSMMCQCSSNKQQRYWPFLSQPESMGPEAWVSVSVVVFMKTLPTGSFLCLRAGAVWKKWGLGSSVLQPDLLAGPLLFLSLSHPRLYLSDTVDYIPPNLEPK